MYKIYARTNDGYYVDKIFSTFHEKNLHTDIFVKEGNTIEYIHVNYNIYDQNMCHNYKIENGKMIETTQEDKLLELSSRHQEPTEIEVIQNKISILECENEKLKQELALTQDAVNEMLFMMMNMEGK